LKSNETKLEELEDLKEQAWKGLGNRFIDKINEDFKYYAEKVCNK